MRSASAEWPASAARISSSLGSWVAVKQHFHRRCHRRNAIAALCGLFIDKRPLHRMQLCSRAEALGGDDLTPHERTCRRDARRHDLAVTMTAHARHCSNRSRTWQRSTPGRSSAYSNGVDGSAVTLRASPFTWSSNVSALSERMDYDRT